MKSTAGPTETVDSLVDRWRAAAGPAGWRIMADWSVPEVTELVLSLIAGEAVDAAAGALGAARATAGVGVDEGMADLAIPWSLLGTTPPRSVYASFAARWADQMLELSTSGIIETASGLRVRELLECRVFDLARNRASEDFVLILMRLADEGWSQQWCAFATGQAKQLVADSFPNAEPAYRLDRHRAAALVRNDDALEEGVVRLRQAVARHPSRILETHESAAVTVTQLPASVSAVREWLDCL